MRQASQRSEHMDIQVKSKEPLDVRLTLDLSEAYLLKVALMRACYMDTNPEDQSDALLLAERIIDALERVPSDSG